MAKTNFGRTNFGRDGVLRSELNFQIKGTNKPFLQYTLRNTLGTTNVNSPAKVSSFFYTVLIRLVAKITEGMDKLVS
jgi:hypothetical protein